MRVAACGFFILALSGHPAFVLAAKGTVVAYPSGCDYFIVDTLSGYVLLEWYGGADPSEGDVVVGDFERYGFKEIHNVTRNVETRVWIEDHMLSQSSAVAKYREKCY